MAYSLFQEVLLQILKQDDLQLSSPRNHSVLSGAEFLLRIAKEGSRDNRMVQAITSFLLHLLSDLQSNISEAIHGGKLQRAKMYQSYHAYATGPLLSAWGQLAEQLQHNVDAPLPQIIADNYLRNAVKETADAIPAPITSGREVARQLTDTEKNVAGVD